MLHYALIFFIVAIVAGVLGFSGIAAGAAGTELDRPSDFR